MNLMNNRSSVAGGSNPGSASEASVSSLGGKAGTIEAHCHAVRYRLSSSCSVDQLRCNFNALIRELAAHGYGEKIAGAELWVEVLASDAGASVAVRRRQTELERPIAAWAGAAWRAIVLEYQSGIADLILVARRSVIDSASLQLLAGAIVSGRLAPREPFNYCEPSTPRADWAASLPEASPLEISWGMGNKTTSVYETSCYELSPNSRVDLSVLIAAVGITAAQYAGSKMHLLATIAQQPERGAGRIGAFEGLVLMPLFASEDMKSREILSQTKERLAAVDCWDSKEAEAALKRKYGTGVSVAIGVFSAEPQVPCFEQVRPAEYLPFLSPPYPLTIYLRNKNEQKQSVEFSYSRAVFDKAITEQFARSSLRLASTLSTSCELQDSEFELLSVDERNTVAALGRPGGSQSTPHQCLNQAFAWIVQQYPQRTALVFGEEQLSYLELDRRANHAASLLRARGVGPGHRVGVCIERSTELVVIILAVTKTRATYVPMDTQYPLDRLAYIASDSAVNVVVSSRSDFPKIEQVEILSPADLISHRTPDDPELEENASTGEDIAYIIYTSGSTGRPKGVAVPHRNVLSLLAATKNDFEFSSQDVWTLFHASSFDFSVWEMWGCLLTGGRLVVVPFATSRTPLEFQEILASERVTVLNQTPSAFAQLIEADRVRPLSLSLRLVIFGGEPLNPRMLLPWLDRWPESRCRIVNMFGITETTVHVTLKTVTREDALKGSRSVGRPLPGWHTYVMDAAGRLLPPGVCGEICVGGEGVAAFYVNKPDLTAQRFVPDPYAPGRLYRSGDKGRLRPDGQLEHLGRLDGQVKLRGFRIEVNEIRAVLLDVPGVTAAAVVFRQEDSNDAATARLDAYVVAANCSSEEVRLHVGRILPDYMMPATISVLASLPLTSNGKLDISALGKPLALSRTVPVNTSAISETGSLSHVLLGIWQKVLKVPVQLDDNFFDLGGNSLYAVRISAALRERQLPPIPLRDLYLHQTVRKIAHAMQQNGNGTKEKLGSAF
jgi:amino acid adenylation domain-containing protein